jgi:hypothetical protein
VRFEVDWVEVLMGLKGKFDGVERKFENKRWSNWVEKLRVK